MEDCFTSTVLPPYGVFCLPLRQEADGAVQAARKEAEDAAALAMSLEERLEEADSEKAALTEERATARERLIAAEASLTEVRGAIAEIRREREAIAQERDRARDETADLRTQLAVAERLREESLRRVERADAEVERLRQELVQVREAAGHERERAIADRTALEHTVSRLSDELADARQTLEERDDTVAKLDQKLQEALVEKGVAESELKQVHERVHWLEKRVDVEK